MRKLLAITFAILSSGVNASETCSNMHAIANSIMKARQSNVSIVDMHNKVDNVKMASDPIKRLAHALVDDAYYEPLWRTDANKRVAISKFANEVYLACTKAGK